MITKVQLLYDGVNTSGITSTTHKKTKQFCSTLVAVLGHSSNTNIAKLLRVQFGKLMLNKVMDEYL